jgi:hypothetical protein
MSASPFDITAELEALGVRLSAPKRGRPAKYSSDAERQAAYRARKGGRSITVVLDDELGAAFDAYIARQHRDGNAALTKSEAIAKLLRTQLLRKR